MSQETGSLFPPNQLDGTSRDRLVQLQHDMAGCRKCALSRSRTQVVCGSGCIDHPDVAFVVEAPGPDEDRVGNLFAGFSGKRYSGVVANVGIELSMVFLCSVVACRPPNNRKPRQNEAIDCSDHLYGQLRLVKPLVIVPLGKLATSMLVKSPKSHEELVGKWQRWEGIPVLPTFAPVFLMGKGRKFERDAKQHLLLALGRVKELKRTRKGL